MAVTLIYTDINEPFNTIAIDKDAVKAVYELTDYRAVFLTDLRQYDVSETFASIVQDIGGNIT